MLTLLDRLNQPGVIFLDGATGTHLQIMGLPLNTPPELWNLENPSAVKKHHQAYVEARADVVLTNTFGGNRARLALVNLADQVTRINTQAVILAQEAVGKKALILGAIGPTALFRPPHGMLTNQQAIDIFAEQASALVAAGVDGLHLETMSDLQEVKAAVIAIRRITTLPITLTMHFGENHLTLTGVTPTEALHLAQSLDIIAFGINCGHSLADNVAVIKTLSQAKPLIPLIAKPNAGLPTVNGSDIHYPISVEVMAQDSLQFIQPHVKMIGGCCGTTPAHITAIKTMVNHHMKG